MAFPVHDRFASAAAVVSYGLLLRDVGACGEPAFTVFAGCFCSQSCEVFLCLFVPEFQALFMAFPVFFNHLVPHPPACAPFAHDRPFGLFADACAVGVSKLHDKQYITVSRILPYMKGNNQSDAVKHNRNIAYRCHNRPPHKNVARLHVKRHHSRVARYPPTGP